MLDHNVQSLKASPAEWPVGSTVAQCDCSSPSHVHLLSNTTALLEKKKKNGNFYNQHENRNKPNNYCNSRNSWKSTVRFGIKSKSECFLARSANAFCDHKIWQQQGNAILVRNAGVRGGA